MLLRLGSCLVLVIGLHAASPPELDEYQVKAAYLYNFAKFVEWPAESVPDAHTPFRICVLGQDPFGSELDSVSAGKTIGTRPIVVARIAGPEAAGGCKVLFVASSERKRVLSVLADTAATGVLLVGESGTATASGMVVNFTIESGRVRFEVDVAAAAREKLSLSSRLLRLATQIKK